jgi:hypothetical protein
LCITDVTAEQLVSSLMLTAILMVLVKLYLVPIKRCAMTSLSDATQADVNACRKTVAGQLNHSSITADEGCEAATAVATHASTSATVAPLFVGASWLAAACTWSMLGAPLWGCGPWLVQLLPCCANPLP